MADSKVVTTGRDELVEAINRFPDDVTAACKSIAQRYAVLIKLDMQRRLLQQTEGEGNTAEAIAVFEDAPNKQYVVGFNVIKNRPANLPLWLEYGTIRMKARPFVRVSADAVRDAYRQAMDAATVQVARETFKD